MACNRLDGAQGPQPQGISRRVLMANRESGAERGAGLGKFIQIWVT